MKRPAVHRPRRFASLAALTVLAVIAGCGSSGGDAATQSTRPAAIIAVEATASPDTTGASVSPPATGTAFEPGEPAMSPTTVDARGLATQEVAEAFEAKDAAWIMCLGQLPSCDVAVLADTRVDPQLSETRALVEEWNAAGYAARNSESLTYRIEDIALNDSLDAAVVTVCLTDGGVLFLPAPDGQGEQIINDTWYSAREAWAMIKGDDGEWRAADNEVVTDAVIGEENNICA